MQRIYLDYNSTAPIDPEVAQVIYDCHQSGFVNPASQHQPGQRARKQLEQDRTRILQLLGGKTSGMDPDVLVFTSGGTESNNLALRGLLPETPPGDAPSHRVLVSAVEHPSVLTTGDYLNRTGIHVEQIPVDSFGVCRLDAFEKLLQQPTSLVSVMLANNETGVIQPVRRIAELCRSRGIRCHTDAVQGVGKIPVDFSELGVDAMTFTAHKLHGPRGIGGLMLRHGVTPQPILFGGFQQMAIRPGTEDVALVAGFRCALERFNDRGASSVTAIRGLRDQLQAAIGEHLPDVVINGFDPQGKVQRVPHTLNFSIPGIDRQAFLLAADMAGLALSTGSACASGSSEPSHVLLAMNAPEASVQGSIRISLGAFTTAAEIEKATHHILLIANNLRR